jgi:hypothetical protein
MELRKFIATTIREYLNESSNNEIKLLQKELKRLEDIELEKLRKLGKGGSPEWDDLVDKIHTIQRKLYQLTGDSYGETKEDKAKKNVKPNGLNKKYDYPTDVPKNVYRWILSNQSLLYSDATDAVRWSRIINTKDEPRYKGEITIYRAVDNRSYEDIREGDWVTTDKKYAIEHNNRYFNGSGKILSMDVNGRDVLVSPTGDNKEAIYAPLKYSIDVKL